MTIFMKIQVGIVEISWRKFDLGSIGSKIREINDGFNFAQMQRSAENFLNRLLSERILLHFIHFKFKANINKRLYNLFHWLETSALVSVIF